MVTDDIYYGRRGAPPTDAAQLPLDLSGAIRQTLYDIYEGTISPEKDLQPEMFSGIWETLNIAAAKGYGEAGDTADAFLEEIRHNTGVFAAFKVHSMQHHMAGFLTGSDGRLRSFDEWREDAAKVASHHCGAWLRTEYDTAVKRAHQAAEWHRFEAERDVLPNLRWVPSTAVEPDSVHRQYWGIVRPLGDAFWDAHKPGDRWGCQCSLEATDDPATRAPGATGPDAAPGLAGNPGKTAQLFSQDHGYFPEKCSVCPYYQGSGKGPQNRVKDCYDCPFVQHCLPITTEVVKRYPNGGVIEKHSSFKDKLRAAKDPASLTNEERRKQADAERIMRVAELAASRGSHVEIMTEIHRKSPDYRRFFGELIGTKYEGKCPDLRIDGKFYEHEGFESEKNAITHMISKGLKQCNRLIIESGDLPLRYIKKNIHLRVTRERQEIDEVRLVTSSGLVQIYP
ncbi:MAG: hypothetical protein K6F98_05700 [Bacteroidales bacterium]|nr:hypothetical protein [Bacteroidales bacterium]